VTAIRGALFSTQLRIFQMSKIHEGWTPAHHNTPLHHDARDNAGLPTARDQGEGAAKSDKEGQGESKYHDAHKSREKKFHEAKSHEEREALREQFAKEDEAKQAAVKPESREWSKGKTTPKEQR
jgi:hypothetical protein